MIISKRRELIPLTLFLLCVCFLSYAYSPTSEFTFRGLQFSQIVDARILVPFGDYNRIDHSFELSHLSELEREAYALKDLSFSNLFPEMPTDPEQLSPSLLTVWQFIREELQGAVSSPASKMTEHFLTIDFLLTLNKIIAPDSHSLLKDSREHWLSGQLSDYRTFTPLIPVAFHKINHQRLDQVQGLYEHFMPVNARGYYVFQQNNTVPALALCFSYDQTFSLLKNCPDFKPYHHYLNASPEMHRFVITTLESLYENRLGPEASAMIKDSQRFSGVCPVATDGSPGLYLPSLYRLYFPGFTHYQVFEKLLPELLTGFNKAMANSKTEEELIDTIADYTRILVFFHPFKGGNGRTIRMFSNLLLMLYGISPAAFETFSPIPQLDIEWREMFRQAVAKGRLITEGRLSE